MKLKEPIHEVRYNSPTLLVMKVYNKLNIKNNFLLSRHHQLHHNHVCSSCSWALTICLSFCRFESRTFLILLYMILIYTIKYVQFNSIKDHKYLWRLGFAVWGWHSDTQTHKILPKTLSIVHQCFFFHKWWGNLSAFHLIIMKYHTALFSCSCL